MQDSIETALERAGITDERLSAVAAEGLEATVVKTASFEGQITDERSYADWLSRHRFWRDLLALKGYLQQDEDGNIGVGGLMIINGPVQLNTGHKLGCQCDECVKAWQEQAREVLEMQAKREVEMNAADVPPTLNAEPERQDAPQTDDSDDWDDWG